MSYTRVLHAFGGHPHAAVMPVDLARYLSLSRRQPLHPLVPSTPLKPAQRYSHPTDFPPKTGLHSPHHSSSSSPSALPSSSEPRSCFRRDSGGGNKKRRVVFADARGLALTAVRLFIPEPSAAAPALVMKHTVAKLQGQEAASSKLERHRFRPGFPQPTQDLKNFLTRLREMHVQLGVCSITDHSLSGKVCVSHDSKEKAVHIKVTFDSWRSHHDIPCTFLQQQRCGGSDMMSVFTFDLGLPQNIDPKERIEFCVYFRPGAGTTAHWDDNRGQNYRLVVEKDAPNTNQGDANRFYPTLSKQRPPTWPSREQTSADLQLLHRTLSSRVREEWKTLVLS
ncbi:protein phosphatase 1 regulatory subunit 3C-like [Limanda limanda]|uniref:protein phosphatase 1 regulatory subunit 3C-like n=1 Tax=Limanda limanda TaxID=27771 RepID=UPI0029C8D5F9|nr:protein phosphatase 1 regulatory subunit 3C-like [Limanda limanda]